MATRVRTRRTRSPSYRLADLAAADYSSAPDAPMTATLHPAAPSFPPEVWGAVFSHLDDGCTLAAAMRTAAQVRWRYGASFGIGVPAKHGAPRCVWPNSPKAPCRRGRRRRRRRNHRPHSLALSRHTHHSLRLLPLGATPAPAFAHPRKLRGKHSYAQNSVGSKSTSDAKHKRRGAFVLGSPRTLPRAPVRGTYISRSHAVPTSSLR